MMSKSDLRKEANDRSAVSAVPALLGTMHPAKRRRSVAKGDLHTDLKKASSASKAAMRTSHEEPIAKRFVPNAPAFVTTSPVILAFTLLSVADIGAKSRTCRRLSRPTSM